MDERRIREEKIRDLLVKLTSVDELVNEGAFSSLSLYFLEPDIELIFESLIRRADTQSIYWLIKYLVAIERPYGFEKILLLLQNENEAIREEAMLAVSKIDSESRGDLLIQMLFFKWEEVVCFAAAELGELALTKATLPLIDALGRSKGKEKALICIVRALGKIRDIRSFQVLERLVKESSGKLQEETLFALSKFTRRISIKYLKKCLQSQDPEIKKIAYLSVVKFKPFGWEKIIGNALINEPDKELKLRILSSLGTIRSFWLFRIIFDLASSPAISVESTLAESVIKRLKTRKFLKWLLCLKKGIPAQKTGSLLRFLSEYQQEETVFFILKDYYQNCPENKFRLLAIECMGTINDARACAFLKDIVKEGGVFSYAASLSLRNYITKENRHLLVEMLLLDQEKHILEVQVFLNFILCLPQSYFLSAELETVLGGLLVSRIAQLRMLAVRCLEKSRDRNSLFRIMELIIQERNWLVRSSCLKSLRLLANHNHDNLELILRRFLREKCSFYPAHIVFRSVSVKKEIFDKLMSMVFEYFREQKIFLQNNPRALAGLILLLKGLAMKHKAFFMEYLSSRQLSDDERGIMMRVVNLSDIHEAGGLDFDFMARQCRNAALNTKEEYINFFRKLAHPSRAIILEVFSEFSQQAQNPARDNALLTISGWLEKSQRN
ncbi:MAG: HEAT repeat domain-containing protein [Candidatus Omnitrophica bacterium]|nr:HEAT repeat domain-containing protein [Candidatus Omnitrophota bacterium]